MARTQLAVQQVNRFALAAVPAPGTAPDVANGNFVLNDGFTVLILLNADSVTHTLTVTVESGVDGLASPTRTYTIPVSGIRQWTGAFPIQFYGKSLLFNLDSTQVSVQAVSMLSP